MLRPGVFLDRDGVLIVDKVHLTDPAEVELAPGAAEAVTALNDAGVPAVVVTNQSVVDRGWATEERVRAANARVQELLQEASGAGVEAFYYCPHHPDVSGPCDCRKPSPGMLFKAAAEHDLDLSLSFMIGDWWSDIAAGQAAGARAVLVPSVSTGSRGERAETELWNRGIRPDLRADDVLEAVELVLLEML